METKNGVNSQGYSESFKVMVVEEVTSGQISMTAAQRKYGIGGNMTIKRWMKKFSTLPTSNKEEQQSMKEQHKLAKLKREKQELESALAQAQLKIITLEKTIEVLEERTEKPVKKKSAPKSLPGVFINAKETESE